MAVVATWLVITEALAIAGLPLTLWVFRRLPDGGYGFARIVGLVLVGYLAWLLSMIGFVRYGSASLLAVTLSLAAFCWWRYGSEAIAIIRERWRLLLTLEGVFLYVLSVAIFVRSYNADIVGQEKFMDYAFMNTFLTARDLPAEDPWLSGFGMPYYHLSYLILGVAGRIGMVPGPVVYNLAVAFVFAAGFAAAVTIVYALLASPAATESIDVGALAFGILGGAMLVVLGNLVGPLELMAARGWGDPSFWQWIGVKNLAPSVGPGILPADDGWWWRSSRVIPNIEPDGITEFPYFSFLLGDLHPHYTAIPLVLTVVGLALTRWLADAPTLGAAELVVTVVVLGVLVGASTWDVPTFWGLFLATALLAAWRRDIHLRKARVVVASLAAPVLLAPAAIWPYFVGYQSQPLGIGIVGERTPLASILILFGPALAVTVAYVGWLTIRIPAIDGRPTPSMRTTLGVALVVALLVVLAAMDGPTLPLLIGIGLALAAAGLGWLRVEHGPGAPLAQSALFTWLLALIAVAILVVVELVYLRDVFGTRMNTVFKFHYHAWMLFALAGAAALGLLWRDSRGSVVFRGISAGLAVIVVLCGLVYPFGATWTKSSQFAGQSTLDGSRFLRRSAPADLDAIHWLQLNAASRPTVIEAVGPDYREYARVSTFSGLPTVLGWVGHELQWRGDLQEYGRRQQDVDAIYRAETRDEIRGRAARYRARFLFFGTLERERYGPDAERRLRQLLPVAYERGSTFVFALDGDVLVDRSR